MRNDDIPVIRRIPTNRGDVFAFAIEGHLDDASLEESLRTSRRGL